MNIKPTVKQVLHSQPNLHGFKPFVINLISSIKLIVIETNFKMGNIMDATRRAVEIISKFSF